MKRFLFALFAFAIAPVGYAEDAAPAAAAATKDAVVATPAADQSALTTRTGTEAERAKALLGERNCVRETGSHIVRKDSCVNATGRSYGQTAIERTGTYSTGVALERLDPAVRVTP